MFKLIFNNQMRYVSVKFNANEGRKRIFWVTVSLAIKDRKPTHTLSTALPCNGNTHSEQGPLHTHTQTRYVCTSQSLPYMWVCVNVGDQVFVGMFE